MESANATQEDFDDEQDYQMKTEEKFWEALIVFKTKIDEFKKRQEDEEDKPKIKILPTSSKHNKEK